MFASLNHFYFGQIFAGKARVNTVNGTSMGSLQPEDEKNSSLRQTNLITTIKIFVGQTPSPYLSYYIPIEYDILTSHLRARAGRIPNS